MVKMGKKSCLGIKHCYCSLKLLSANAGNYSRERGGQSWKAIATAPPFRDRGGLGDCPSRTRQELRDREGCPLSLPRTRSLLRECEEQHKGTSAAVMTATPKPKLNSEKTLGIRSESREHKPYMHTH